MLLRGLGASLEGDNAMYWFKLTKHQHTGSHPGPVPCRQDSQGDNDTIRMKNLQTKSCVLRI